MSPGETTTLKLYSSRLDVPASSRGEDEVEHNPVPRIQTVSWPLVSIPVVFPQLCAE